MSDNQEKLPEVNNYKTLLILDWKKGTFRALRKAPRSFKPTEIPIDVSLTVTLPKPVKLEAKGEIKLSEAKVADIVLHEM